MNNAKIQAAQDLQRFAQTFRSLVALSEELIDVGSLEQAGAAAKDELVKVKADLEAAMATGKQKLVDLQSEFEQKKIAAEQEFAKLKANAQAELENAKALAGSTLAKAYEEAKAAVEAASGMHADKVREMNEMQAQIQVAKVDHASVLRDVQDAKKEHGRLSKLIADLKAKF